MENEQVQPNENEPLFNIEYVNWGIANRFPNKQICLNKRLQDPEYSELHDEIIQHEMEHTDTGYSLKDFKLDLKGFKNKKLYRKFILKNPSSWIQFSPLIVYEGRIYFDINLLLFWGLTLFTIGGLCLVW